MVPCERSAAAVRLPCWRRLIAALGLALAVGSSTAADGRYPPTGYDPGPGPGDYRDRQGPYSGRAEPRYGQGEYRPQYPAGPGGESGGWTDRRTGEYRGRDGQTSPDRSRAPWLEPEYVPDTGPRGSSGWTSPSSPPSRPAGQSEYFGGYSPWEAKGERPWARPAPRREERRREAPRSDHQGPPAAPPPPPPPPPLTPYAVDPYLLFPGGGYLPGATGAWGDPWLYR